MPASKDEGKKSSVRAIIIGFWGLLGLAVLSYFAFFNKPAAQNGMSTESTPIKATRTRKADSEGKIELPRFQAHKAFKTQLTKSDKTPIDTKEELKPPAEFRKVTYKSGPLELTAYIHVPESAKKLVDEAQDKMKAVKATKASMVISTLPPLLVYSHRGFALSNQDFADVAPFVKAGFAVMIPTFRGERENPGSFEFWLGELTDLKNAIWYAYEKELIEPSKVYVLGRGLGSALAAEISLHDDVSCRATTSVNGLFDKSIFDSFKDSVPFNVASEDEVKFRLLMPHQKDAKNRHFIYLGKDEARMANARDAFKDFDSAKAPRISVEIVPGTEDEVFELATKKLLENMKTDKPKPRGGASRPSGG